MAAKPVDHFGPLLDKAQWLELAKVLEANDIAFEMKPAIREEGLDTESGKFIVKDPAGNILEFKYYASFTASVAGMA